MISGTAYISHRLKSPRDAAEGLLKRIAEESGGRVFFYREITCGRYQFSATEFRLHDPHSKYVIGYQRQGKPGENGFLQTKVSLKVETSRVSS